MKNNNKDICVMRTVEYKENGVEETFNIGTSEEYLSADFTREQLRQLRDRIDIVLAEGVQRKPIGYKQEDVQRKQEERQKELSEQERML